MVQPGLLRLLVPLPRQRRDRPCPNRQADVPLRQPPPSRPLRPALPVRARQQGRHRHPARLPPGNAREGAARARFREVPEDEGLRARQGRRRPAPDGDGARGPDRRPDRRLGSPPGRRRNAPAEHERQPADRPRQASRLRPARPPLSAVLRRHLVSDGLRVPREGARGARSQEARGAGGARPPLHRDPVAPLDGAVGRPAVLPRPAALRVQRPA